MKSDLFEGFVLAGGKSSRMKTDKAFLKIGGETFLERTIKTLRVVCENRIKVVINLTQNNFVEQFPADVLPVFDFYENRGALGGIHAALKNCQTKYAIILAVDLPFVMTEAIEKLAEITLSSNKFVAVVPRQTDGRLQPLCAIYYTRYCLPTLENLLKENDSASVRDFLELIAPHYIEQKKLTADATTDIFFNVNYPTDFRCVS